MKGFTVGIPKEYHCAGLSSEMIHVWNRVADLLANNGAHVTQVNGEFLKFYFLMPCTVGKLTNLYLFRYRYLTLNIQ